MSFAGARFAGTSRYVTPLWRMHKTKVIWPSFSGVERGLLLVVWAETDEWHTDIANVEMVRSVCTLLCVATNPKLDLTAGSCKITTK